MNKCDNVFVNKFDDEYLFTLIEDENLRELLKTITND
jgi:hypothetical protein